MKIYTIKKLQKRSLAWISALVMSVILAVLVSSIIVIRYIYLQDLKPVNASQRSVSIIINRGASAKQIGVELKKQNLIRSNWSFEWYLRSKEIRDALQSGTYELRSSQSVQEIVDVLTQGKIVTDLVTILPDQRIGQIRARLISNGFSAKDVDEGLNPELYKGHPALVDKPIGASLEGYLYPESFQKSAGTKVQTIIRASLDEMQKHLTPELRAGINQQGLTVYEGIILASIVEREVSGPQDRAQVAQVFLKRIKQNMKLQSDPTAVYGAIEAGKTLSLYESLSFDSPYNTYIRNGLPVGPISNVTESSLRAVAKPANGDYLYFVSGDDGNTYFSRTFEEHNTNVALHCKKLCGL